MALTMGLTGDTNLRNLADPGQPLSKGNAGPNGVDVLFGNLEGCFFDSDRELPYKPGWYHVPTVSAPGLLKLGFDAVGCGNNVTYGADAIASSLALLDRMGVPHTGAGPNLAAAKVPVILPRDGIRLGFLQYTSIFFPIGHQAGADSPGVAAIKVHTAYQPHPRIVEMPGGPATVLTWPDPDSLAAFCANVRAAKAQADVLVVSNHWGISSSQETAQYQVAVGHAAIESGADIVIGHGPHVIQGIDVCNGKPIFYSLGNFVFGWEKMRGRNWVGLVVRVAIDHGKVIGVSCSPVHPDQQERVSLLTVSASSPVLEELRTLSESYGTHLEVQDGRIAVTGLH